MFVGQSWTDRVRHFFCLMKSKLIWNLHKNSEMWNVVASSARKNVKRRGGLAKQCRLDELCLSAGLHNTRNKGRDPSVSVSWIFISSDRGYDFCFSSVTSQNQDNEGKQRRKRALHINTKGVDRTISFVFGDLLEASVCRGIFVCWLVTRYTWIKSH